MDYDPFYRPAASTCCCSRFLRRHKTNNVTPLVKTGRPANSAHGAKKSMTVASSSVKSEVKNEYPSQPVIAMAAMIAGDTIRNVTARFARRAGTSPIKAITDAPPPSKSTKMANIPPSIESASITFMRYFTIGLFPSLRKIK